MDGNKPLIVAMLFCLAETVWVLGRPTSSVYLRHLVQMWKCDRVFPYCSICTEFHSKIYRCEIQTNILIVTPSTVPTSRVTVNINFSALDTSTFNAEDKFRKNKKSTYVCLARK